MQLAIIAALLLAHRRALRARRRLEALADGIPGALLRLIVSPDESVHLVYASEGARPLTGLIPPGEPRTLDALLAAYHPDDRPAVAQAIRRSAREIVPLDLRARLRDRHGTYRWTRQLAHVTRGEHGSAEFEGVVSDISQIVETERALADSEQRYRMLVSDAHAVLWEVRRGTFDFSYVSDYAQTLTGYPTDRWLQPGFWASVIHHEDRDEALQFCATSTLALKDHTFEYRMIGADGRVLWVRDLVRVTPSSDGGPPHVSGILVDITALKLAQADARRSTDELNALIAGLPVGIIVHDGSRICYANAEALRILRAWSLDQLAEITLESFFPPQLRAPIRESIRALMEKGGSFRSGHQRLTALDGSEVIVDMRCTATVRDGAKVIQSTLLDLTALLRASEALAESDRRLRMITESAEEVFWLMDVNAGTTLYVSSGVQHLYGVTSEALVSGADNWTRHVHPDDLPKVHAALASPSQRPAVEFRVNHLTRGLRWVRLRVYPVAGSNGLITCVHEDITERQLAETARELFFRVSLDMLCVASMDGQFIDLSDSWFSTLGYSRQEMFSTPYIEFVHPEDRASTLGQRDRLIRGESILDFQNRYICKDGSVRWLSWFCVPDVKGARVYAVARDVTQRREEEARLRRTLSTKQLLLKELDHRVKNSMAGLLALIEMMRSSETSVESFANAMRRRVLGMSAIHTLLSATGWSPLSLRSMLSVLLPPESIRRFTLEADDVLIPARQTTALGMLLQELVTNAVKHGALSRPEGSVRITWDLEPRKDDSNRRTLRLRWRERTMSTRPEIQGLKLGLTLVETFARFELGGTCQLNVQAEGGADHQFVFLLDDPADLSATEPEPPLLPAVANVVLQDLTAAAATDLAALLPAKKENVRSAATPTGHPFLGAAADTRPNETN